MADYRGAGGGGAAVVPASLVVASDREDYPLTQAGLAAAIAALPATGGDIYIGAGTLALTSPITIDRDIRIFGAGVGNTVITMTGAFSAFLIGDFFFSIADLSIQGDTGATDQIAFDFTASSTKGFRAKNVLVGVAENSAAGAVRTVFDVNTFSRFIYIDDCSLNSFCVATPTLAFMFKDTNSSVIRINDSFLGAHGQISGSSTFYMQGVNWGIIGAGQSVVLGTAFLTNCVISGGSGSSITIGDSSYLGECSISAVTISLGAGVNINGGLVSGSTSVIATGDGVTISGAKLSSFSGGGFDYHSITGNRHTTPGTTLTITLTDCSFCVVAKNERCEVLESGSSTANLISEVVSTSTSTTNSLGTVNGVRKNNDTGNTSDAYNSLFTALNPKGVVGSGSIKNTDGAADQMTVEEQGIDGFGVTDVKETVVAAGDYLVLNPQAAITTARPPYVSYRVRVKSTTPGAAAPFSYQFASEGPLEV